MPIMDSIARPSFRASDEMASLLQEAGGSSAAIKGLIYLGLAAVGYDVSPAVKEIRRLAGGEHVAEQIANALIALAAHPAGNTTERPPVAENPPAAQAQEDTDPSVWGMGEIV